MTAGDAYVRGYRLFVPRDCVAAQTAQAHENTLGLMQESFATDIRRAADIDFAELG